mgnify:FL=1
MVTQETSTEKSSRTGSPRSRPWLSPRVADGYGSTRAAILFSEAFKAFTMAVENYPEELEVQIEKRRIVMEKRQVNEEERRQFLPEMDLEPVEDQHKSNVCPLTIAGFKTAILMSL